MVVGQEGSESAARRLRESATSGERASGGPKKRRKGARAHAAAALSFSPPAPESGGCANWGTWEWWDGVAVAPAATHTGRERKRRAPISSARRCGDKVSSRRAAGGAGATDALPRPSKGITRVSCITGGAKQREKLSTGAVGALSRRNTRAARRRSPSFSLLPSPRATPAHGGQPATTPPLGRWGVM